MDLRALIFMPALVGAVIMGFVCALFLAHYYLNVMESSGSGASQVTWISESILDNFWKFWYMLWIVGFWLGPVILLNRRFMPNPDAGWVRWLLPFLILWVCYPISQLSSLSASTIWLPFVPDVVIRLLQKPQVFLGFLLISAPIVALVLGAFYWAFMIEEAWVLLLLGCPLLILGLFLYAWLLGRLAFVLRFTKGLNTPKKKKKKPAPTAIQSQADEEGSPTIKQPDDLPAIMTPLDGELHGYQVLMEDEPPKPLSNREEPISELPFVKPRSKAKRQPQQPDLFVVIPSPPTSKPSHQPVDDDDAQPYDVNEPGPVPKQAVPKELTQPREDEMRLISRENRPVKPKQIWGPEVLTFLFQPGTISAIVIASGFCLAVGVFVRLARAFNPAVGPD